MLQGYLNYKCDNEHILKFRVIAKDSFNDLRMQLSLEVEDNTRSNYIFGAEYLDLVYDKDGNPVNDYYGMENFTTTRRLEVKKTNKYKSNIVNRDFCSKISALIRYAQISGSKNYSNSEHEEFVDTRQVTIDNGLGKITYRMGLIIEMHIKNSFISLDLTSVDDKMVSEAVFKELKEKDKYGNILSATPIANVGFKLCEELLGFPYEPKIAKEKPNILGMYTSIEEVIADNPDKNTDWILDRKYTIVSDDILEEVINDFLGYDGLIAFDTETTGLNINFKSRTGEADELVGVVLSKEMGTGYYFPLQHKMFKNLCDGDHAYFMERYMRPILEGKKIICHNVKYDWKVAYIYDINTNCVYDTMLAFGVTKRYEEESFELGLKALAHNILGLDMFDLDDFVIGGSFGDSDITFADLNYELVRRYAPADADMTLSLYNYLEKQDLLTKYNARMIFDLEIWFSKAVAYSEFYGYHIDVDKIPRLAEEIEAEMNKHKQAMFKMAGYEFNPNSSQQLMKIMYDEMGIEMIGGKRSTQKEILHSLSLYENVDGTPKYPFVRELKLYRDSESIYKNFLKKLHNFATSDGYIFPDVLQLGTDTGRVSVKNPNYQSYNDVVKHYVVPRPGFMHFDSDFAQIEQRVLVSYASIMFNDFTSLALLKDFDDPDMDYHQYQAARMFNVPYAAVTKSMRQQSKGINFGLPYGMGDSSLGARIFGERNNENTAKAATLRRKFFQGQELIEKFFKTVRDYGVRNSYTSTQFGRRRYYHRSKFTEAEIRRQAGNHVIQGCLHGDTRIQTKELGVVKIKDVVGYSLSVWDGAEWTKGDILYSGKKRKCIITFRGGQQFICSPIHKFSVIGYNEDISEVSNGKKFVECKDLKEGIYVECNTASSFCILPDSEKRLASTLKGIGVIPVESVEITDEYIDMYDVCNTERGYYVADGVITHNTAADIYKIAVVNMFKRLCKEGWLGKVLFNGFIHDEILMEVHSSINPYYFMKVWRDEFEVKLEHYCRLFAGAGVGYCWYDAKKLDLPPEYIDELINKYYDGMPWDGDIDGYLQDVKDGFKAFKTNKVKKYITASENQGNIIKPAISALLPDEVAIIISELQKNPDLLEQYNGVLMGKIPFEGKCKLSDLQDQLFVFCKYHGVDINSIDIKSADDVKIETEVEDDSIQPFVFKGDGLKELLQIIALQAGYWVDYVHKVVYMTDFVKDNIQLSAYLVKKGYLVTEGKAKDEDFEVIATYFNGSELREVQETPLYLRRDALAVVAGLYRNFITGGATRL